MLNSWVWRSCFCHTAVFPLTQTFEVKAFKVFLSHESTAWLFDTPQSGQNCRQCPEGGGVLHVNMHRPAKKKTRSLADRWAKLSYFGQHQRARLPHSNSITLYFSRIPFSLSSIKGCWMVVQALKAGRVWIVLPCYFWELRQTCQTKEGEEAPRGKTILK